VALSAAQSSLRCLSRKKWQTARLPFVAGFSGLMMIDDE
jgi:hypothetical protein